MSSSHIIALVDEAEWLELVPDFSVVDLLWDLSVPLGLTDSHSEAAISDWLVASHHDGTAVSTNVLESFVPWVATVVEKQAASDTWERKERE
jgi:hypothetical protein